jgi:ribosomal-protein-alanine N-acetyltransferase
LPLTFVRFQKEHLGNVMAIELEAYPEPWTEGMFRQELNNARFYVAFLDGVLVGYAGFWGALDEAHITSVTVRHDYRRLGLGRRLVRFILDLAARQGMSRATLEVRRSNVRAQSLYRSMGFAEAGVRKGYYRKTNEDAIIMSREDLGTEGPG